MNPVAPPTIKNGRFVSSDSGLLVPRNYVNHSLQTAITGGASNVINRSGYNQGYSLPRDEKTLILKWFQKGSGLDDYFLSKIADGTIGNVGISPLIAPIVTTELQRQVTQAATASIELTGRKSTVRRAREAISRFDDSPLGATDAIQQIVRNLRTYNRGAPIATIPIHYDMGQWQHYGMTAIPMTMGDSKNTHQNKAKKEFFYLDVDWKKAGGPVPFIPSIFDLEATGMKEFPYWYRATMGTERHWVLLHWTQCIPVTPGKSEAYGIGTSSLWMCLKHIAEDVLEDDRRIELLVNSLADGLLGIGPVYMSATQISNELQKTANDAERRGNVLTKGYQILASPTDAPNFNEYSLRKDSGIDYIERLQAREDHIARAFQVPLSAISTRGGVGYGSQADTVADEGSSGGVDAILQMITTVLGTIYPRVQVAVKRKNDRAQRLNMSTLKTFSESFKNMNSTPAGIVISADMGKALIDREILDLPSVDEDIIHTTANGDEDSTQENQVSETDDKKPDTPKKDKKAPAEDKNLQAMFAISKNIAFYVPSGAEDDLPDLDVNPDVVSTSEFDLYWHDEDYPGMLDSEVFETEDDVEDDNSGRWVWIAGAWLYLIASQDRRVDRTESISVRDTMVEQRHPTMTELLDEILSGAISIQTFSRAGWNLLQEGDTNSFRLGRGGLQAMTDENTAILSTMLNAERNTWTHHVQTIADGRYSEGQIRNYSSKFVNTSTTFYERGNAESYGLPALPQYPGDGQTQCHNGCQCSLHILPLPGKGNFDVRWNLGRAKHCTDCKRMTREWNPLRIRKGIIL